MLSPIWIVAFSGHRPSSAPGRSREELAACRGQVEESLRELNKRANARGGTIELLTGVASGADLVAVDAAEALGLPVHVILPMPEASFLRDFGEEDSEDLQRAELAIERAKAGEGGGSFRIAIGDNSRPGCYHEANLQMLEACDAVLAVWNGQETSQIGGTPEFVDEAERVGIPTIVIDPGNGAEVRQRGEWEAWPAPDQTFDQVKEDIAQHRKPIVRSPDDRDGDGTVWQQFILHDEVANAAGGRFRRGLILAMLMHFTAALLAAFTAAYSPLLHQVDNLGADSQVDGASHESPAPHDNGGHADVPVPIGTTQDSGLTVTTDQEAHESDAQDRYPLDPIVLMTTLELVLVFIALLIWLHAAWSHSHHKWRRNRFAAELCHGLIESAGLLDPLRSKVVRLDDRWRRYVLSVGLAACRAAPKVPFEQMRAEYLTGRVENQIEHFSKKQPRAGMFNRWLGRVALIASVLAPLIVGTALWLKFYHADDVAEQLFAATFAVLLPVVLPLIAGGATSLIVSLDADRRAERYGAVLYRLKRQKKIIPGLKTEGSLRRTAQDTEDVLLDELFEWYTVSKNMGH